MNNVNKVILVGNIGKTPSLSYNNARNTPFCSFSLATNDGYLKNGEYIDATNWHTLVFWGDVAVLAEKLLKVGDLLYVEGALRNNKYESGEGIKYENTEILVREFKLMSKAEKKVAEPISGDETE